MIKLSVSVCLPVPYLSRMSLWCVNFQSDYVFLHTIFQCELALRLFYVDSVII